jgi:hypothetical protein
MSMSFCADDNAGYFETIQLYFTELTRRSMFLSGRDLELLDDWRDNGASASAICKGLRDAVEAMPDEDPPRDVYACRRYVEPYVERAAERSAGGHDGKDAPRSEGTTRKGTSREVFSRREPDSKTGSQDLVERALDRIERAGRRTDDPKLTDLYRDAWRAVRELFGTDGVGERFEELAAVEEALVENYFRVLDREERERIEERIAEGDAALLERMSPDARRQHLRARRRKVLMREYDLISLIDYSDERESHE